MWSLFTESVKIEVSDIHIILGASTDLMSKVTDFSNDPKNCAYDCNNQMTNIAMMHEIVEQLQKPEKDRLSKKKKEARAER